MKHTLLLDLDRAAPARDWMVTAKMSAANG